MGRTTLSVNFFHVELSMETFKNYSEFIENSFENKVSGLHKSFDRTIRDIEKNKDHYEDDYKEHLKDSIIEEMYEIEKEFMQRFRNSLIMQLFSFLESELKHHCELHAINYKKEYSIDDLKGTDLEKVKLYLKKSANKDLTKLEPQWKFINDLKKLRNRIVHDNSMISEKHNDYKSIKAFSKTNFTMKDCGHGDYLIILDQKKFINQCFDEVQKFLEKVIYP